MAAHLLGPSRIPLIVGVSLFALLVIPAFAADQAECIGSISPMITTCRAVRRDAALCGLRFKVRLWKRTLYVARFAKVVGDNP